MSDAGLAEPDRDVATPNLPAAPACALHALHFTKLLQRAAEISLHIDGRWRRATDRWTISILNPANEQQLGTVACASVDDLDNALEAAAKGFATWRLLSAYETRQDFALSR